MKKIKLSINNTTYEADQGQTILEVARENGIWIPTLCHDNRLDPYGGCRICLVEVKGTRQLQASCITKINEGMAVCTESENIQSTRKGVLEYILSDHPLDCMTCEATGCCELQDVAYAMGIKGDVYRSDEKRGGIIPDKNEVISRETPKCIRCGRCVRICGEVQQDYAIDFGGRGFKMWVATPFGESLLDGTCVLCGQCASTCPTGAILDKKSMNKGRFCQTRKVRTTCGYCSIGCQIDFHTVDQEIIKITSDVGVVPNNGNLCTKGRYAYDFISDPDRLEVPMVRKNGNLEKTGWESAYKEISGKIEDIKSRYGSDAIGFISSGRCTNEENYLLQKFARAVIGTNNIDQSETECHQPTFTGLKDSLGFGTASNSIGEISTSDVIFVFGANITEAHPIIGLEIKKAVKNGSTLIVTDTRDIWLKKISEIYMTPKPGSDTYLINALISVIVSEKLYNENFVAEKVDKFEVLKESLPVIEAEKIKDLTGVSVETIKNAARIYASAKKATIFYGSGITQQSTGLLNVQGLANLTLLTGHIGKEGTGLYPLSGQNNGQGALSMGATPYYYTDSQPVTDSNIRSKFEQRYNVSLPEKAGLTIREMINSAYDGKIRALFVMGTDILMSEPDTTRVKKALKNLDLLIVQDIFMSNTAQYADVLLPAACFAEKDGSFTNIERRVQRVRKASSAPGKARADWNIISELSTEMGYPMNYQSPEAVWEEIREVSPNFAGIDYQRIEKVGVQWPCPDRKHPGTKYLYDEKFPHGKATFSSSFREPSLEPTDTDYPFTLSTGRTLYHFNTGSMTLRSSGGAQKQPYAFVEISQADADNAGIKDGDMVRVSSKRGAITLSAKITNRVKPEQIWIPFHYFSTPVNLLTMGTVNSSSCEGDPGLMSGYKTCLAKIERL
ncbi:MAG: formate dehydrogenase subunit alpha [Planctomycetes bacterium]|nr:formate dehydrogenase subunit alpha [Planctomycetota bacterium]